MPRFSQRSKERLATCDKRLQRVFNRVIDTVDCTILEGHRSEEKQNEAYRTGHSKVQWPDSRHNTLPSLAVDVAPYPIDWRDRERFTLFAGFALGVAAGEGVRIVWGGDWNRDFRVADNSFDDLVHFQVERE